jgi:hypothetical protein
MALTEKEFGAIKVAIKRRLSGEKAGRKWADDVATIRDLERIYDASRDFTGGVS